MIKIWVFVLALMVSLAAAWMVGLKKSTKTVSTKVLVNSTVSMGQNMPQFETLTIEGERVSFVPDDKIKIVNFWASWCAPCMSELPSLVKFISSHKGKIQLLAVSADKKLSDIKVILKAFPQLKDQDIKIIFDEDQQLRQLFSVQGLPESYFVSAGLKLEHKVIGAIDWTSSEVQEKTVEMLRKSNVLK
jgi:thiol-disulfide isomerase/thioredoxin